MLNLKNETKELFKKAGLENFTVARNNSGYLVLVGECGKSLAEITNFTVGSKLTKKEREICIDDYITPALAKNAKLILGLIKAKEDEKKAIETFDKEKEKIIADPNYQVNFSLNSHFNLKASEKREIRGYVGYIVKNKMNIRVRNDHDKISVDIVNSSLIPDVVKEIKKTEKHFDNLMKIYKIVAKCEQETRQAELALRTSCNI